MGKKKIILFLPSLGILVFVGLYVYAASLYPGGSQADEYSIGFDWINNYWCNLLNEKGINGETNKGRLPAIIANVILCSSLIVFFVQFSNSFVQHQLWKKIIPLSGSISMIFSMLVFTSYHDLMTILSSIFGIFAVVGIIREIYLSELTLYKITGLFCVLLLLFNNYIYYSEHLIVALPLLQKITFAIILSWIVGLNCEYIKLSNEPRNI